MHYAQAEQTRTSGSPARLCGRLRPLSYPQRVHLHHHHRSVHLPHHRSVRRRRQSVRRRRRSVHRRHRAHSFRLQRDSWSTACSRGNQHIMKDTLITAFYPVVGCGRTKLQHIKLHRSVPSSTSPKAKGSQIRIYWLKYILSAAFGLALTQNSRSRASLRS